MRTAPMSEGMRTLPQAEHAQHGPVSDTAQCEQHRPWPYALELCTQIGVALDDLRSLGLVRGRQALDGVGDPTADEAQGVLGASGLGRGRETGLE